MSKNKSFFVAAGVSFAMAFAFSCSFGDDDNNSLPIGSSKGNFLYEGKTYKTVKIGRQTWMAENLDYAVNGSICYDDDPENCAKYGSLYTWATAMDIPESCNSTSCVLQINAKHRGICPEGWHIPSNDDWDALHNFDGFAALMGGGYSSFLGSFVDLGSAGYWWSANEYNSEGAYGKFMNVDYKDATRYSNYKSHMCSVRCIQD